MNLRNLTRFSFVAIFAIGVLAFTNVDVNAQGRSGWAHEKNRIRKQQKAYEKAQKRAIKDRYRVNRNGSYYYTDQRGADLLRRAVQEGYRQGYNAGINDRRYGRRGDYYGSDVYRRGTYGYRTYVDRDQYEHYFREGFERGYYDGYNSRTRYGYRSNSTVNILGAILNGILNLQRY
jgi:flagellar biosynthesis/type III secretory pathway protein FliH